MKSNVLAIRYLLPDMIALIIAHVAMCSAHIADNRIQAHTPVMKTIIVEVHMAVAFMTQAAD